jgi:hypothetical protein
VNWLTPRIAKGWVLLPHGRFDRSLGTGETVMNTFAPPPGNYDYLLARGRRVLDRETMAKSMLALILLAGLVAFAFTVGESVQESRAANDIIGAAEIGVSKQQPERSGVLFAQMPVF